MQQGTIIITEALYNYMKPECDTLFHNWLNQGAVLSAEKINKDKTIIITLEHPDFVESDEQKEYRLSFKMRYTGWYHEPTLGLLEMKSVEGTWSTVKVY